MWKKIMGLLIAVAIIAYCFPALAEVVVKSEGTKVTTAVSVDFQGATVSKSGDKAIVNIKDITGNVDVSGTFKAGTADAFSVDATGIIVDSSLYTTTAGTGGSRYVCVTADGKVYAKATTCP